MCYKVCIASLYVLLLANPNFMLFVWNKWSINSLVPICRLFWRSFSFLRANIYVYMSVSFGSIFAGAFICFCKYDRRIPGRVNSGVFNAFKPVLPPNFDLDVVLIKSKEQQISNTVYPLLQPSFTISYPQTSTLRGSPQAKLLYPYLPWCAL